MSYEAPLFIYKGAFYNSFEFEHRNKSINIRYSKLHQLGTKIQPFIPHQIQSKILPLYLKLNSKKKISMQNDEKKILETLKKRYNFVKKDLKEINPILPLNYWNC